MTDKETKKQLVNAYKEQTRKQAGGIYMIKNTKNGKVFIDSSLDISAAANRFAFSQETGSCTNIKLGKDWAQYGSGAFTFEIVETIEKNEEQTTAEFREDLQVLKAMRMEKFEADILY